jgi:hypothetical protein
MTICIFVRISITCFAVFADGDLLLTNIMPGPCNARICVRVSRFWDFYDPGNETKLLHSDMVLLDEELRTVFLALYLTMFLVLHSEIKPT